MPTLFKRSKICDICGKWHRVSLRILHVQGHSHVFDIALHRNADHTLGHKERAPEIVDRVSFSKILRQFAGETLYYDSATEVPETRTRWEAGEADSELLLVKAGPQGPDSGHVRHWQS